MEKASKIIIISLLTIVFFAVDREKCFNPFLMHFHHANIFHLMANCCSVYLIRRASWLPALAIAILSALPFHNIVGFSGVIFAALGILYGRYPSKLFWWAIAIVLVTGLIPNVSMGYHLVNMFAGFIVGYIYQSYKLYEAYRNR